MRARPTVLYLALLGVAVACSFSDAPQRMVDREEDTGPSNRAIRSQAEELRRDLVGRVRDIGAEILFSTSDSTTRMRSLYWAIFTERESSRAARHADGVVALVDLWTLLAQMDAYFATGNGADLFPEHRDEFLTMLRTEEARARAYVEALDDARIREEALFVVQKWIEEHPIHGVRMRRDSTVPMFASLASETGVSVFGNVQMIEETLERVDESVGKLAYELPVQLILQIMAMFEFYLGELEGGERDTVVGRVLSTIESVPNLVEQQRIAVLEAIEQMRVDTLERVTTERVAVLQAVGAERATTLAEVDRQRLVTVEAVAGVVARERRATLEAVELMRRETIAAVRQERVETLAEIERMRIASFVRAEQALLGALEAAEQRSAPIIDAVFWRLAALLGVAGVGAFALAWFVVRATRRN